MTIPRLKAKLTAIAREISTCRDRVLETLTKIEKANADLATNRAERSALETEHARIEGASAVELHRLALTPEQAAKKSDAIGKKAAAALSSENEASSNVQEMDATVFADLKRIEKLLKPFIDQAELLSHAELLALLCGIVDPSRKDVLSNFGPAETHDFFRCTFVADIHAKRKDAFKGYLARSWDSVAERANLLFAIVDGILEEPLPSLARAEAVLPEQEQRNSRFIQSLQSLLRSDGEANEPARAFQLPK